MGVGVTADRNVCRDLITRSILLHSSPPPSQRKRGWKEEEFRRRGDGEEGIFAGLRAFEAHRSFMGMQAGTGELREMGR